MRSAGLWTSTPRFGPALCAARFLALCISVAAPPFAESLLAFANTANAMRYCRAVQKQLEDAKWPQSLPVRLARALVSDDAKRGHAVFSGLRVQMAVHTGRPQVQEDPLTQRTEYSGSDVGHVNKVCGLSAGGQILLTATTVHQLIHLYTGAHHSLAGPPVA